MGVDNEGMLLGSLAMQAPAQEIATAPEPGVLILMLIVILMLAFAERLRLHHVSWPSAQADAYKWLAVTALGCHEHERGTPLHKMHNVLHNVLPRRAHVGRHAVQAEQVLCQLRQSAHLQPASRQSGLCVCACACIKHTHTQPGCRHRAPAAC